MLEQQGESDEDCEVYFLKPVNEYNIVEKIKEANKELFAESAPESKTNITTLPESGSVIKISTTTTTTTTTTIRKVTFAPNLEDYEPESANQIEIDSLAQTDDNPVEIRHRAKTEIDKFPTIDEEDQLTAATTTVPLETSVEIEDIVDGEAIASTLEEPPTTTNLIDAPDQNDDNSKEDDVDEICEEIIVMEMDSNTTTTAITLLDDDSFMSQQQRRLMLKQATFDYDEQDNKSLTNLLTASDCEEEDGVCENQDQDEDTNDASIFSGIDDFDEDDDDDKLSLIVASYLPDDFDPMSAMSTSPSAPNRSANEMKSSTDKSLPYFRRGNGRSVSATKNTSSSSSSTFGRRFQLHRKAHSTNSIGTVGGTATATKELPDLKLNYKTCCEYRNSIQGKLPKYTGYLSEYGLSREQLQQREQKLQKKQRFLLQQTLKTNEHEMQKMQDNERAFTTWLRNKMRFPINKTRNMFDVKLGFSAKNKTALAGALTANSKNGDTLQNTAAKLKGN